MAADPTTLKVSPNTITQITAIKKNGTAITPITYTTAGPISPTPTNNYNTFSINDFLSGDIVTFSSQGYSNLDVTIGTSEVVTFTEGYQTIAFYKHAGVTYEIEDEKARQDIATKQDALTTQTAYSAKGSATKVPQITTNNLGQVTNITEVTISQPTVNNKTITIQKNSTTVDSFTLNQSTDKTINITVPTKTSDITNDSGFLTEEVDTLGTVLNRGNSATTDINMNSKDWFNAGVKLTSYYYSTSQTPNTQYYWYKLEPPTSGSKADRYFISIDSDVNYPQNRATFLLDISKYSSSSYNVSLNCLAMTGGKNTHVLNVAIDADGYVYVQSDAVWSSYMRFVRYGTESSTISYTQVGLAAFGTAAGFTPVKMITDTGCIRLLNGAESGTYYTVLPSHYFRGDLVGNADTATKATKDGDGNTISTTYLKSHQSIKSIKSDNTTAQSTSSSEAVAGSGTINLHKVSKTGSYSDLLNKPTIPATNVIPATTTANKILVSTTTSGTAKWSDFSTAGLLKTNTSGVVSVDTTTYGTYSKPSGGIPASDLAESYYLASNPSGYTSNAGTVTSVRVQAGTGLASSTSTAQSTTLNTTISIASGYKLPTTTEWSNKQDKLTAQTAYTSKGSATKVPQITTNTLGQVTGITEVDITQSTVNNSTITIQKNSTTVDSFTLNQSSDKTIDISVPTTAADVGAVAIENGVTAVTAGSTANKLSVTKNGTTSTITINNVANATSATSATSSNKTSGLYDKYYRAYAGSAISTYGLVMKGSNGRLYPLTTPSYDTASTKAVTTTGLRPDFIWLYDGNAAVSAGGVIKADVLYPEYGSTAGNKYLNSTVPTYCDIYLCGNYDATKDLFYLSTTNASGTASTTSFYALVPYNSEPTYSNYFIEGRYYIFLGSSYSTANYFQLKTQHPLYYYDGTNLIKVDKKVADSAISTHNSSNTAHSSLFSGKQDTLATQTAYNAKGTATKVPQITTNSLGQVTGITEIDITHPTELPSQTGQSGKYLTTNGTTASWGTVSIPTVNNSTITIQKNGTNVDSFTTNAASGKNINITLAKGDVGLGNVDNTADLDKPISTVTQTALDAKQNTISDLGYIRNQVAKVDDKISGIDITDSGDSLPSAANYSVRDTFLNKTDKKLYTVETPAWQLNSNVTSRGITVNLTNGAATGFNSTSSPGGTTYTNIVNSYQKNVGDYPIYFHFKTGDTIPTYGYIIAFETTPSYYKQYLGISGIADSKLQINCFTYYQGRSTNLFNHQLFDTSLEPNTEYYIYITYNGSEYISTLSSAGYNINILETSTIEESTTQYGTSIYYGGFLDRWPTYRGMTVYLADSMGEFVIPDGALTWDSGTTLENNTQYNDTTNEKTIYYNNDIIYEGGSVAVDSSTITLNSSNQIQTVGYKDVRTSNTLKTWTGTRAQYDAIATKDANTLYNITDDTDTTLAMLELLYPVGAVYIGTMGTCPLATLGIGSWEQQTTRFLVEKKEATSNDPSWYNLYSDGWCEQGGKVTTSASSGAASTATITFSKPFIDLNYEFHTDQSTNSGDTSIYTSAIVSPGRSTSSLSISSKYISSGGFGAAGQVTYRWNCSYYTSITSDLKMWRRIS